MLDDFKYHRYNCLMRRINSLMIIYSIHVSDYTCVMSWILNILATHFTVGFPLCVYIFLPVMKTKEAIQFILCINKVRHSLPAILKAANLSERSVPFCPPRFAVSCSVKHLTQLYIAVIFAENIQSTYTVPSFQGVCHHLLFLAANN